MMKIRIDRKERKEEARTLEADGIAGARQA